MKVYLDLDEVLADFDQHFKDTFGFCPRMLPDKVLWQKINGYETFYADLPSPPDVRKLFEFLTDSFDVSILTVCPKSNYRKSAPQKKAWGENIL
jgi:5'-nucleotidase